MWQFLTSLLGIPNPLSNQSMKNLLQVGILPQNPCWALWDNQPGKQLWEQECGNDLSDHHFDLLLLFCCFSLLDLFFPLTGIISCAVPALQSWSWQGLCCVWIKPTSQGNVCSTSDMGILHWFETPSVFLDNEIFAFLYFYFIQTSQCQF